MELLSVKYLKILGKDSTGFRIISGVIAFGNGLLLLLLGKLLSTALFEPSKYILFQELLGESTPLYKSIFYSKPILIFVGIFGLTILALGILLAIDGVRLILTMKPQK